MRKLMLALFLCLGMVGETPASIVMTGTRIIYPSDQREVTVKLDNKGKTPALGQVWVDYFNPKENEQNRAVPFVVTPMVFRMDAQEGQVLRIVHTQEPMPVDRESLFRFNLLDIPPKADEAMAGKNYVQMSVLSQLKLFYRPSELGTTPEIAVKNIRFSKTNRHGNQLRISNQTPFYFTPIRVALIKDDREWQVLNQTVALLPPFEEALIEVNEMLPKGLMVLFEYVNDFGGKSQIKAPLQIE